MRCSTITQQALTRQAGITLLNVLIATSIFAIVTAVAVPGFNHAIKKHKQKTAIHTLHRLFNFARVQAVETSLPVVLCPSADAINCVEDWTLPLMVFIDKDKNEERAEEELLLRHLSFIGESESLRLRASGGNRYVSFTSLGTTGNQNGRFYYCNLQDERYRSQLVVYRTGRARIPQSAELREEC